MNDFEVRELTPEMLGEAAEIEKLCFSEPWSPEALLYMCKSPNTHAVAVIIEGRLAAYGGCEFVPPEANIVNIATHPDFRRRGCAAAVIDSLEEFLSSKGVDSIFLEVRASNAPARALYEGKGFAVVGVRKNYYRFPTEDAEVMLKTIS
jgi:ribosomal-protein-alanine N-acetyltransferase